jgi:hypothetical protein
MVSGTAKRHHYVPKFYLRRFACADDGNKVLVLERHHDALVASRKSIDWIGFEERLYDFGDAGRPASVESDLNRFVETPFSRSPTWSKISDGSFFSLDATDGMSIYGFARHLRYRNCQMLRFLEGEHARFLAGEIVDLTDEEREMHNWIARSQGRSHELFREAAMDTMLPEDSSLINVMICYYSVALRTSTNPTVIISHPGRQSLFGEMFDSLRIWWLTLDAHWGAFVISGGAPGFSNGILPEATANMINRQYLVQLLNGDARFLLAEDPHMDTDLEWGGFAFDRKNTRELRYRAISREARAG